MKSICVPLTQESLIALDQDNCDPSNLKELNLSNDEYKKLLGSGVIEEINLQLDKIIDEYEDESIQGPRQLKTMLSILESSKTPKNHSIIVPLIELTQTAIKKNTGVFFFF